MLCQSNICFLITLVIITISGSSPQSWPNSCSTLGLDPANLSSHYQCLPDSDRMPCDSNRPHKASDRNNFLLLPEWSKLAQRGPKIASKSLQRFWFLPQHELNKTDESWRIFGAYIRVSYFAWNCRRGNEFEDVKANYCLLQWTSHSIRRFFITLFNAKGNRRSDASQIDKTLASVLLIAMRGYYAG